MAAGVLIKHKRKAGAFIGGELAAGELGLDVTNKQWYFSVNGTTVEAPIDAGAGTVGTANSPEANEFARFTGPVTIEGRSYNEAKIDLELNNVTNESKATMFSNPALTGVPTAPTAAPSTNSTQLATTAYTDAAVALAVTGLLDFKGAIDASTNPNYPVASKGDTYVFSVAGKIGGVNGGAVDVGDMLVAIADSVGGTFTVAGDWAILEHNLAGAYIIGGTDVAVTDGGTGASTASDARTNLGLAIGSDVAAFAHTHAGADITSGDIASARMQTNVAAALVASTNTLSSSNLTIDGGSL